MTEILLWKWAKKKAFIAIISRIENDGKQANRFGVTEHNWMTFENERGELIVEPIVVVNFSPLEVSLTVSSIWIRFYFFLFFGCLFASKQCVRVSDWYFGVIAFRNCCESSHRVNIISFYSHWCAPCSRPLRLVLFFTELNDASIRQTHIDKKQHIENVWRRRQRRW